MIVGGLVLLALYGVLIWRAPNLLINQDVLTQIKPEHRLPAEHNARLIVVSIGGALVVATGLLYTARNYRLAHRGQVTDRFTKALERLGSDELYVRIGGVHALEHVMRDSPVHHGDVVEVLVAFIRDRTPRAAGKEPVDDRWMHPPIAIDAPELPSEPEADVQAALTALGRRPDRPERERGRIDLSELHLQNAKLMGARLERVNLRGAQLRGADLWVARLQGADLRESQLRGALLWITSLQGADLKGADLQGASLNQARLQRARLIGAKLQGASLIDAQLQGTRLEDAELTQAQLDRVVVDDRTVLPEGLSLEGTD
ncbi:pentapeptide repeat-containing protein [Saccharothrix texasensis]|uniref:pentapeptide repeat-containing protein n=1 Tax=Saccharothrix texasensis TaxID=103734 RepID=UPI001476D06C|nr:pentapeptide repeat-containing protein [Saccharothrix texasensis]